MKTEIVDMLPILDSPDSANPASVGIICSGRFYHNEALFPAVDFSIPDIKIENSRLFILTI
jgi:hypothetical protein